MPTATTHNRAGRPRGAARRKPLLQATLKIVGEVGTDAVTHRRVAEVAGLRLASTTYHFESKEHLLTAALELAAERDIARLKEVVVERGTDFDPIELAVAVVLDPIDETITARRGLLIATYALLLEAARRPALQAAVRRWTDAYFVVVGRLLQASGSINPAADAERLIAAGDSGWGNPAVHRPA
jgi:DNA-binding transcriptional regulator YbjK